MGKKVIHDDVRINKFISDSGFCSRREADQLVTDERVTINGKPATLGSRVAEGDKVRIDGEPLQFVPMEMREYKLRRYGSSRHANQEEGTALEPRKGGTRLVRHEQSQRGKSQEKKPLAEHRREESRRGRGEGRKASAERAGRSNASRGKKPNSPVAGGKLAGGSASVGRRKSAAADKTRAERKRRK